MDIEVDQSGKIEDTRADTVIAFSDSVSGAALIPAVVKRACIRALRERDWRSRTFVFKIFAAALFVLIQPHIGKIERIVIDVEYPERMGDIKGKLLHLIQHIRRDFTRGQIVFDRVGKRSPAHKKAIAVYRGRAAPDRVLTANEILRVIGK
ncbi:MAG: hypothetical protein FJ009_05910 [Chloroflexi bacterium]|nr:hypothetical protein [Chloroflexota bacterium]